MGKSFQEVKRQAVWKDDHSVAGSLNIPNANLTAALLAGPGTGDVILFVEYFALRDDRFGPVHLGNGSSAVDDNKISFVKTGSNSISLNVRQSGQANVQTGGGSGAASPTIKVGVSTTIMKRILLDTGEIRAYENGRFYGEQTGFAFAGYNIGAFTNDVTFMERSINDFGGPQSMIGAVLRASVYFTGGIDTFTDDQLNTIARELHLNNSSSLLDGMMVLSINPDETDAAAGTVRDLTTDSSMVASFSAPAAGARIQEVQGKENTFFSTRGGGGGDLVYMATAEDPAFATTNGCLWEWYGVPQRADDALMGDDAQQLTINGTSNIAFMGAATTDTIDVSAPITQFPVMCSGYFDGTNAYAAIGGYLGAASAAAGTAQSGSFCVNAYGDSGTNDAKAMTGFLRVWTFNATGDHPSLEDMRMIMRYHAENPDKTHPVFADLITQNKLQKVEYSAKDLVEVAAGFIQWGSDSVNTTSGAHDMDVVKGTSNFSTEYGDRKLLRRQLYVGDPSAAAHSPTDPALGGPNNKYQGASALANAVSLMNTANNNGPIDLRLGDYDYTAAGTQTITKAGNSAGNRQIIHGTKDSLVEAIASAIADFEINGLHITGITGSAISLTGNRNRIANGISRDSTVNGALMSGEFAESFNFLFEGNDVGLNMSNTTNVGTAIANISTENTTNSVAGPAAGNIISRNNNWNGTLGTGVTEHASDLVSKPPALKDIANQDYSHLKNSNTVHSGLFLPGINKSWDQGPLKYTGYRVFRLGPFNIVKG